MTNFSKEVQKVWQIFQMSTIRVAEFSKWAQKVADFQNKQEKCGIFSKMSVKSVADFSKLAQKVRFFLNEC